MKTELTIENKQKFFALHFGQEVHALKMSKKDVVSTVDEISFRKDISEDYLYLNPLSSITDEDAKRLAVIEADFRTSDVFKRGRQLANSVEDCQYSVGNFKTVMLITDYLRSKGYALPWMGLSVDEMVQAGWIKLKEA